MKNNILLLITLILVSSCINRTDNAKSNTPTANKITEQLRHVVLFRFKEACTSADIQKVEAAFIDLPSKIKEIKKFEWGLNNSPEALNKGFTHCFFVTFDSEEDRSIYLPHHAHMAFVNVLNSHLEDVLVLDYWAK
ncbi:Dabb family protein [Algibacter sp.]|nr:Dabb family protein [Algibacter sp.]MDA9070165.1 Dabb family protein [Algibacter sp.]MDA9343503.1 Dabb family protein [Algibacter sp.]